MTASIDAAGPKTPRLGPGRVVIAAAGLIALLAGPILAQQQAGPVPGSGFLTYADYSGEGACERGFFEFDGRWDPAVRPATAFLGPESYGPERRCTHGFAPAGGTCVEIDLPANAHFDRSGHAWRCDRCFQLSDGECVLGR